MIDGGLACHFAAWAASLTADAIPEAVRIAARRALLDTLAVMAAGARHEATAKALAAFGADIGPCRCVDGRLASPAAAALINGVAAHAYDFDDTSYCGIMHGSAVILPPVLAAAEASGADDADVLAAFIAGSEVAYALGDIVTSAHYFRGWWATSTLGLIGAAAGAARAMRLDSDAAAHAIALAAAMAGGGKAVFGSDGKPLLVGMAARNGLSIAQAARSGMTGPRDAFEDARGFFALLNAGEAMLDAAADIGRRWRLAEPGLLVKRYPICSAAHAAVEQTAAIVRAAAVAPDEIDSIVCEVPTLVDVTLVFDRPATPQQAQFSLPYTVACAVHHGGVRLEHLTAAAIADPAIEMTMNRVTKRVDPALSTETMLKTCPESARLLLTLKDGRRLEGFCAVPYGMPARPLEKTDLLAKASDCLRFAGHGADSGAVWDEICHFGQPGRRTLQRLMARVWPNAGKDDPILATPVGALG